MLVSAKVGKDMLHTLLSRQASKVLLFYASLQLDKSSTYFEALYEVNNLSTNFS